MKSRLRELFGIDLRTLALARIGLSFLVLLDLSLRARDLSAHYTDQGVLPRSALRNPPGHGSTGSVGRGLLLGRVHSARREYASRRETPPDAPRLFLEPRLSEWAKRHKPDRLTGHHLAGTLTLTCH